jgi:imidazolonepropionase
LSATVLLQASELVTLAGPKRPRVGGEMRDLGVIRNGGMLIRDGLIVMTGKSDVVERLAPPGARMIDAAGRVVLPGFVDAHAHPVFAGNRVEEFESRAEGATYAEIAESGGGIQATVRQTRKATEDELVTQALKHANWFLHCGTTTVEAKSGYGLSVESEIKLLRVIRRLNQGGMIEFVPTFLGAHAIPEEFRSAPDRYVNLVINEMLPRVVDDGLAEFCDVFCEPKYFDVADARAILRAAKERGLQLRIHADQLTRSGGAELAAELGAVTADHLEQTEESGIAALKQGRVQPVLLPGSVYSLGQAHYPRARAMIDAGLAVVLATDFNPGSSPTPSMQMVLSLAATHLKMTAAESIAASTINAAYSLSRGDKIGSLEEGKRANFTVFNCEDHRELAYYFGFSQTRAVYVAGENVYSLEAAAGSAP